MTPNDYYKAAKKHLTCCQNWYDKTKWEYFKDDELLVVYYLLGYVAECFTVYTVYRFGHWNPKGEISRSPQSRVRKAMNIDIEEYFDPVFTYHTGYDYFNLNKTPLRCFYRQIKGSTNSKEKKSDEYLEEACGQKYRYIIWKKIDDGNKCDDKTLNKAIVGSEISEGDLKRNLHTQGHKFQKVIKERICVKLLAEEGLNNVNFFAHYKEEIRKNDAFTLIEEWSPKIRYYSSISQWEKEQHSHGIVTRENLVLLMDVLKRLYEELDNK